VVKILFFVCYSFTVSAQLPAEESTDYLYKKNWCLGIQLATNGFGANFTFERNINAKFKHGLHLLIGSLKGGKETRITNSVYADSRSYVFGKINLLFTSRAAYSGSWLIFERRRARGVTIRFTPAIGPSMGIIKPIYLKIKDPFAQVGEIEPQSLRYDPFIHTNQKIYGRASVWKGFSESTYALGVYLKSGFQFDFSSNNNRITAVEIGLQLDCFSKKIDLFYLGDNAKIFPGFYASVQFGKNKI